MRHVTVAEADKLGARWLATCVCAHVILGSCLDLGTVSEDELYRAMDWLLERQGQIEKQLAKRHLQHGCLVLYDLTSTYFEGRHCPIAHYGHSRDERTGNLQIVFGLLTDRDGRPVAVEVSVKLS